MPFGSDIIEKASIMIACLACLHEIIVRKLQEWLPNSQYLIEPRFKLLLVVMDTITARQIYHIFGP